MQGLLSMMPNGTIDVNSITVQIQNVVKGFEMTMRQLADITTAAYDILRNSGYIGKYFKDSRNFFWKQYEHLSLSKEDVGNYWDAMIGNGNPNATWRGKNKGEYIKKYITDSSNKGEAAKERVRIRRKGAYSAADAATKAYNNARKLADQNKNGGDASNPASPNASTKGGILSDSTGKKRKKKGTGQKDYESKYNRNASRPTQVIINIDKLANFDRTAIAKDSDERAIASAIEVKIAEAVSMLTSQILTTASSTISQGLA